MPGSRTGDRFCALLVGSWYITEKHICAGVGSERGRRCKYHHVDLRGLALLDRLPESVLNNVTEKLLDSPIRLSFHWSGACVSTSLFLLSNLAEVSATTVIGLESARFSRMVPFQREK